MAAPPAGGPQYQPLDKDVEGGSKALPPEEVEYKDPELKENGGQYTVKITIGQVTVRLPPTDPLLVVAMIYGFLPWLVPAAFAVWYASTARFIPLYGICIAAACALVNEGILKPLIKDPRPALTANRYKTPSGRPSEKVKYGMPSGHVFNACALMVWLLLEIGLRGDAHYPIPLAWFLVVSVIMVPVPWARWYNSDHTAAQCGVSLILGLIVGSASFYIRITKFPHHYAPWKEVQMHDHHDQHHQHDHGKLL
jgi:hypothetical protein